MYSWYSLHPLLPYRSPTRLILTAVVTGYLTINLTTPSAQAQNVEAAPLFGEVSLDAGFSPDPYVVEVIPGGSLEVENLGAACTGFIEGAQPDFDLYYGAGDFPLGIFVQADVDTTLVISAPDGSWYCNDDAAYLSEANPGVLFDTPQSGLYDIWVGTYSDIDSPGQALLVITEYGAEDWASLDLGSDTSTAVADTAGGIDFGDDSGNWANDGECDDPRFEGEGMASVLVESDRYHDASDCRQLFQSGSIQLAGGAATDAAGINRGRLESGDDTLPDDSYVDYFSFDGVAGGNAVIDLRSGEFDTFLFVRSPGGEEFVNDDFESSIDRSVLSLDLAESGTYQVGVTSYNAGETGGYTLDISTDSRSAAAIDSDYSGNLAAGDSSYSTGEFFDRYEFQGRPGQRIAIDLRSDEFDTYLVFQSPNGESEANDDADGTNHSRIETELSERGTYEVQVTSYAAAETGNYLLRISELEVESVAGAGTRDATNLALGDSIAGSLQNGDRLGDQGRFEDSYSFTSSAGENIGVDLRASGFDTYLALITPSGERIENDDHEGSLERSYLELTTRESGRYRVIATSYGSGETGDYNLSIGSAGTASSSSSSIIGGSGAQVYGIFTGIADYPGTDSDLPLTDQDAVRARDALIQGAGMQPGNAVTLLNEDATLDNLRNAISRIGASAGSDDTLVIFYSGHGGRVPREDGPDSRDPDGMDETMVLYDYNLLDDELAAMLDQVDVGKVLLVMDSCFSGGFSKDIVARPGRMGLFSSEEDVLSQVALKFQAGGYLSVFFEEALTQPYADRDNDGDLTAIELSQYLHDRFRSDVKSFGTEEYVRASGPQANYQQLVVDRGGIGPYNVLFSRQ